jgi:hypothetical protein
MNEPGSLRCAICGRIDVTNRVCEAYSSFTGHDEVLCRRHEFELHAEILAVPGAPPPEELPTEGTQ